MLKNIAAQSVRARFKHCPEPPAWIGLAQCAQSLANSRRMVRKIVDNGHAIDHSANLKPPLNALERRERFYNRVRRHALSCRKSSRGTSVQRVMLPRHRQTEFGKSGTSASQSPARNRALVVQVRQSPMRLTRKTIFLHRTESLRNTLSYVLAPVKSNNASPPRNKIH